jgi:hypothetical protein
MDTIHCDDHKIRVPRYLHRAKLTPIPMAQLNAKSELLESCAMKTRILPFLVGYQPCKCVNGQSLTSSTCSGLKRWEFMAQTRQNGAETPQSRQRRHAGLRPHDAHIPTPQARPFPSNATLSSRYCWRYLSRQVRRGLSCGQSY